MTKENTREEKYSEDYKDGYQAGQEDAWNDQLTERVFKGEAAYNMGLLRAAEIARKYTQPVVTKEEVLLPKTYKYEIEGFNKACETIATVIESEVKKT